jgi:hypothetical protein
MSKEPDNKSEAAWQHSTARRTSTLPTCAGALLT